MISPKRRAELLAGLREPTRLPVKRVKIVRVDFLNDTANLRVIYDEPRAERSTSDVSLDEELHLAAENA